MEINIISCQGNANYTVLSHPVRPVIKKIYHWLRKMAVVGSLVNGNLVTDSLLGLQYQERISISSVGLNSN